MIRGLNNEFLSFFLVAGFVLLTGCGVGNDFSDLRTYMDEVRAKPKGAIEPLPTFQPYESFTYRAASLRSPFQPPVKIDVVTRQKGAPEIKPDESRVKQFLEGFNIETFEMVGTLRNDRQLFALVNGAGGVHRVKVGDFLGRNHGKILVIDDSRIDVVEIVPDGEGGWLERPRSLSLKERS
ncbi:type 4a pilus biogenesis lipoprotein PilP [Pseudomonas sp. MDMC_285]|nr:type 4a pilus biogenesis lipoprotein PilP [Pseudomonas sp. MDMC_285]